MLTELSRKQLISAGIGLLVLFTIVFLAYKFAKSHVPKIAQLATVLPQVTLPLKPSPGTPNRDTTVNVFLVAVDDNGKNGKAFGCQDSIVSVKKTIPVSQTPIQDTLNQLFSLKNQYYKGLYNSLYQSTLRITSLTINKGGVATVDLLGTYTLGGTCDGPRIVEQIKETVLQFPSVSDANISLNGMPIEQLESLK